MEAGSYEETEMAQKMGTARTLCVSVTPCVKSYSRIESPRSQHAELVVRTDGLSAREEVHPAQS